MYLSQSQVGEWLGRVKFFFSFAAVCLQRKQPLWSLILKKMLLTSWKDKRWLACRCLVPTTDWLSLLIKRPHVDPREVSLVFRRRGLLEIPLLLLLSEANLGLLTACDAKLPIHWPQPTAYFENLFVTAVAKQLSAVFLRCLPPSRCWDPNAAVTLSKITVVPRQWALWRPGSVLPILSWSLLALLACFHKALCPLTPLIILLVRLRGVPGSPHLSLQHVLWYPAWYWVCESWKSGCCPL